MIRVLLVDDHTLVRAGLSRLLDTDPDIEVVGVAGTGEEALVLDARLVPDVVLMDVSMPGVDGVETTASLVAARPDACVVMLSANLDHGRVIGALDAGACGYLAKDADPRTLIEGVRSAAGGEAPLDARAGRALLDARSQRTAAPVLTGREAEVLACVAEGLANKAIARRLGISEKTVKSHLTRAFAAIGVSDRTQAALWAVDHGVLVPSGS